jgi:hypothetical protein
LLSTGGSRHKRLVVLPQLGPHTPLVQKLWLCCQSAAAFADTCNQSWLGLKVPGTGDHRQPRRAELVPGRSRISKAFPVTVCLRLPSQPSSSCCRSYINQTICVCHGCSPCTHIGVRSCVKGPEFIIIEDFFSVCLQISPEVCFKPVTES